MRKVICLLLAFVLGCSLAACSGPSEKEECIERVIARIFTCPDEELVSLIRDTNVYVEGNPQPDPDLLLKAHQAGEEYAEYLKTFLTAEDMTEDLQEQFCGSVYLSQAFPRVCVDADLSISVKSVKVEMVSEENRRYDYSAELIITDQNGEEMPYTQEGKVQLCEDGRISWIDVKALMELSDVVVRTANGMP